MKKGILSRPIKGEKGSALILVLILVLLCGLILTPLLAYMASGVKIVRAVHEEKMNEFYAADAGVEDAIWQLQYGNLTVPPTETFTLEVNDYTVSVTVENAGELGYKITSEAGSTKIDAYVDEVDFSGILNNSISSVGTIPYSPNITISGQFSLPDPGDTFAIKGGSDPEKKDTDITLPPSQFSLPDAGDTFTIYNDDNDDSGTITVTDGSIFLTANGNASIIVDSVEYSSWTVDETESVNWTTDAGFGNFLTGQALVGDTEGPWTYSSVTTECAITSDVDGDATICGGGIIVTADYGATINGTTYWEGVAGQSASWSTPGDGGIIYVEAGANNTQGSFVYKCPSTEVYIVEDVDEDATVRGESVEYYDENDGDWPSADGFSSYYLKQVDMSTPYTGDTIDVKDYSIIENPESELGLYKEGNLEITNSGTASKKITLEDTLYVNGKLTIGDTGHSFILDLNGHTIFVADASEDGTDAILIGGKCSIIGSGCIIALGNIQALPQLITNEGDFVLVMSIMGVVVFHPSATFWGSIAANTLVNLLPQPLGFIQWVDWSQLQPPLNFPGTLPELIITSWKITIIPTT